MNSCLEHLTAPTDLAVHLSHLFSFNRRVPRRLLGVVQLFARPNVQFNSLLAENAISCAHIDNLSIAKFLSRQRFLRSYDPYFCAPVSRFRGEIANSGGYIITRKCVQCGSRLDPPRRSGPRFALINLIDGKLATTQVIAHMHNPPLILDPALGPPALPN